MDLSGGIEQILEHYDRTQLHVGYRVHPHILMASTSKPSALVAEDGRGTALANVAGGMVVQGHKPYPWSRGLRAVQRLGISVDSVGSSANLSDELVFQLREEISHGYPRSRAVRTQIDILYKSMQAFLLQLP